MTLKLRIALLAVAGLLALPILASAAHWPNFGGDAGRSGYQPIDEAAMPASLRFAVDDPGKPRTSPVTSLGKDAASSVVAYGEFRRTGTPPSETDETRIHIRDLATGAEKVPADQQVIESDSGSDDDDTLGTDALSVSPVNSSSAASLGQLFVVHNEENHAAVCGTTTLPLSDNDIAIAQFDLASGQKVKDLAVGSALPSPVCAGNSTASTGYTIESSPVITPPLDSAGRRVLFFVARRNAGGDGRLFRVEIGNAASREATINFASPEIKDIPGLNTKASPSIAYLRVPGRTSVAPYVVVSAGADPTIQSFTVDGLQAGPKSVGAGITGTPQTVSVPVAENGLLPGQAGSGATGAPGLFAAYQTGTAPAPTTTVRRFVQNDGGNLEVAATSAGLDGAPSPALAVTETVDPASGAVAPGSVVVSTGENLYILRSADISDTSGRYRDDGELELGDTEGFSRNSPSASGGFIFIANDGGAQLVLRESDGEPVPAADFTESPQNAGSDFAIGQPAYSDGYLQFLSDDGLFVYRTRQVTQAPVADFTITPNPVTQGDQVTFDASASKDPDGSIVRYEWDLDGNGTFETDRGAEPRFTTTAGAVGTYGVRLRVTDDDEATGTATKSLVIQPNQAPAASFTATPNPVRADRRVTYDARASKDADGSITRYEWDLDGNGSFETSTGATPTATRTYRRPAAVNVKLRVTDDDGATGETSRQVVVTRAGRRKARRLGLRVRPKSDTTLPHSFTARGRLVLPKGMSRRRGCRGRVTVTVKRGKSTISRRTTKLRRDCRYRKRVSFSEPERLGSARTLKFKARFQGNRRVLPRQSKTRRARID